MASYNTERLAQEMMRVPGLPERYKSDRKKVMDEYGIPEAERAALENGTPPALSSIQLHPILQIHFLMGTDPHAGQLFDGSLLNRLKGMKHG
jgi:hypothetical protein